VRRRNGYVAIPIDTDDPDTKKIYLENRRKGRKETEPKAIYEYLLYFIQMHDYKGYFWSALHILQQEGLTSLCKKSVRHSNYLVQNRIRSISGKDQWKKSRTDVEDCNEKILGFISGPSKGGLNASEAFMSRVFIKNMNGYHGLPKDYIRVLLESIEKRQVLRDFCTDVQDVLIRQTSDLDPRCLPPWRWLALQYLCTRNGFFKSAYIVRQKAVEIAYIDAENTGSENNHKDNLDWAFRAAIDQAAFEKARTILDGGPRIESGNEYFPEWESYYNLNTGNLADFQEIKEKDFNGLDKSFRKYVEGKSIAIIGPAQSGEVHGDEIDSFDIVIRFNYNGDDKMPDWKEFGRRSDISYYANSFSKEISDSNKDYFKKIDFSVFKKIEYDFQKQLLESQRGRVLRRNNQFFNGSPLAGSHALFDILHFRPQRVKLFNVNFYLTNTPYHKGYFDGKFQNYFDKFNFQAFAHHDLMSNINFTRNLWNADLIEVDTTCREVISLTTYDYLSALENLFIRED
jgi:hypothetical protein